MAQSKCIRGKERAREIQRKSQIFGTTFITAVVQFEPMKEIERKKERVKILGIASNITAVVRFGS